MRSLRVRALPVSHEDNILPEKYASDVEKEEFFPLIDDDAMIGKTSSVPKFFLDSLGQNAPPSSILLLNMVAVIWGTQHAVIKMVVNDSQAAPFTLLRFGLAALIASPYLPGLSLLSGQNSSLTYADVDTFQLKNAWRWGAELGFWMFLGFSLQAIGLASTTAQRSGFLLYLNVKFVPFFARVFLGRAISIPTWISAFVAFFGTALVALDGQSIGWNEGDLWSVAAAASSAMFILRLEKASSKVPDSAQLNATSLWVVAILAAIWTFTEGGLSVDSFSATFTQLCDIALAHPIELLYLGGVTTALANYIQAKGQKDISAERASIIYSLDPVYGAFFSWLLLGETLGGAQAYVGAGLITLAAATNAFLDLGNNEEKRKLDS
jgi:drug/metabolite transporter (DMT)-like permease